MNVAVSAPAPAGCPLTPRQLATPTASVTRQAVTPGGPIVAEVLSTEDLFVTAAALRRERANRAWKADKTGHTPRGLDQLLRLERTFDRLARTTEQRSSYHLGHGPECRRSP